MRKVIFLLLALLGLFGAAGAHAQSFPTYDHVIIVVMENHGYSQIVGDTTEAPYINGLLSKSAVFTNYLAITHPSQPNYFALYAGDTFGVTDNNNHTESDPSLFTALNTASKTFKSYIETTSPRKHNPWESFSEGTSVEADFSTFPSSANYASLPNVAFVIPNLTDDMHDGTITQGDTWLKANLDAYITWATTHSSLFILTFDEDDSTGNNQVLTLIAGAHVQPGNYSTALNHYGLLGSVEQIMGTTATRNAASAPLLPSAAFTQGTWTNR